VAGLEPPAVAPGLLDARPVARPPRSIDLRVDRLNSLLGTALDAAAISGYLRPLGFAVAAPDPVLGPPVLGVGVPSFRPDVTREVDVIEEVARMHGYSSIERTRRDSPAIGRLTPQQRRRRELSRVLTGAGATEAWTSTFLSEEDHERAGLAGSAGAAVRVSNPLVSEEAVLRRSVVPGLLKAVRHNAGHRNPSVRLFEIGHVFEPPPEGEALPDEREVLGVVLAAEGDDAGAAVRCWRTVAEALGIRGVRLEARARPGLHPTRSADLVAPGDEPIGSVGEIDPAVVAGFGLGHDRVGFLGLDLGPALAAAGVEQEVREVSRYPSSDVDLAFEVDEGTPAAAVESALAAAAGDLCESLALFDVYRGAGIGAGRRSLAFRLRLCAPDRTLGDAELGEIRRRCVDAVVGSLPASLRA
jgi:phenylalanyl-tRNA synthetase beta chain